jgi:hypothetical protein
MKKLIIYLILILTTTLSSGCVILDIFLTPNSREREERQIEADRRRARNGERMRHHDNWEDLRAHEEDLKAREDEENK